MDQMWNNAIFRYLTGCALSLFIFFIGQDGWLDKPDYWNSSNIHECPGYPALDLDLRPRTTGFGRKLPRTFTEPQQSRLLQAKQEQFLFLRQNHGKMQPRTPGEIWDWKFRTSFRSTYAESKGYSISYVAQYNEALTAPVFVIPAFIVWRRLLLRVFKWILRMVDVFLNRFASFLGRVNSKMNDLSE